MLTRAGVALTVAVAVISGAAACAAAVRISTFADTKPPVLSKLAVSPKQFHKKGKLTFRLSEPAQIAVRFDLVVGRRTRTEATGEITGSRAGTSTVALTRRVGTKTLPPGRYRLTAVPTDAAGNRGGARTASFSIAR